MTEAGYNRSRMNHEQYLAEFSIHLRVAEPKRSEIITELKTHFEELGHGDASTELGDPKGLAQKYNRTHIGFWHSEFRISLTLVLASFISLFAHLIVINQLHQRGIFTGTTPLELVRDAVGIAGFLIPLLLSVWFGWTLAKMHRPAQALGKVILVGFLTSVSVTALDSYHEAMFRFGFPDINPSIIDMFSASALLSIFKLMPFVVITSLSTVIASQPVGKTPALKLSFLKFQMLVAFLFILLSFPLAGLIAESFDRVWIDVVTSYLPLTAPATLTVIFGVLSLKRIRTLSSSSRRQMSNVKSQMFS